MQIELLQKWITQGTEPMISPDYPKIDWSKEIIRIFGTDEIINPSELSASLNDLAYELISFEWWFYHATKNTYSIELLNNEVKHCKTNFREKLIAPQYKWAFYTAIKRIKRNAPDKLSRYIDLWESRMELCELSPNNVLCNEIFIPMIERLKNGDDYRHFIATLLPSDLPSETINKVISTVIDCDKYDSDKIYETFGTGLFFTCTKKVFDDWFVKGIENKDHPELNNNIALRQVYFFLQLTTEIPNNTKESYFKTVFRKIMKMNNVELKNAKKLKKDDLYEKEIKQQFQYLTKLRGCTKQINQIHK